TEIVSVSQTTNQAQIVLRDLESRAQSSRQLHDSFLQRYMETVQQQSFPISDARVITRATPPLRPSNPRTMLVLMVGPTGGAIARHMGSSLPHQRSGCEHPAHGLHSDAAEGRRRAGDLAVAPAKDRLWRLGASNHQA